MKKPEEAESPEARRFLTALRGVLSVSKEELDAKLAEHAKAKNRKRPRKRVQSKPSRA